MPQPRRQPPPSAAERAAAAGAAAGAGAAAAGTAPGAAATLAVLAGTAAGAAVIAKSALEMADAVTDFGKDRGEEAVIWLAAALADTYPTRPPGEIRRLQLREAEYEKEFRRRQRQRLLRDLPSALGVPDADQRKQAVAALLEREKRYTLLREEAMLTRSMGALDAFQLRQISPQGAYWKLSPYVREHTLDCLMIGEKFWPWSVLSEFQPPLHHGCPCHLLGLDEAVQLGLMTAEMVPDPRDAELRYRRIRDDLDGLNEALAEPPYTTVSLHVALAKLFDGDQFDVELVEADDGEAVRPEELVAVMRAALGGDLAEASVRGAARKAMRWQKGFAKGGQFRPQRGGDPGARVRLAAVPPARSRRGRWSWVKGRATRIPEGKRWHREIDGVKFESPAGSTNVYRNAKLIDGPDGPQHTDAKPGARRMPKPKNPTLAKVRAEAEQVRAEMRARARGDQTKRLRQGQAPVSNLEGPEALLALRDADYVPVSAASGGRLEFRNPDGDAVALRFDGQLIRDVAFRPASGDRPRRVALDRAPQTWDEHVGDAFAWADDLGQRFGAQVYLTDVVVDNEMRDHGGRHDWTGEAYMGYETPLDIARAGAARATGRDLSEDEKRGVYSSYWVSGHEIAHAVNPIDAVDFEGAHANLEEALTEEAAHILAVERLTEQGQHDIVEWRTRNPESDPVRGLYGHERQALGQLLDHAGITDDFQRREFVMDLKFRTPPHERLGVLARALADGGDTRPGGELHDHVELTMEQRAATSGAALEPLEVSPGMKQTGGLGYGRFRDGALSADGHELKLPDGARRVLERRDIWPGMETVPGFEGSPDGKMWALTHYPPDATESDNFRFVDSEARGKLILRAFGGKGSPGLETEAEKQSPGLLSGEGWLKKITTLFDLPGEGEPPKKGEPKKKTPPPKPTFIGGSEFEGEASGPIPNYDQTKLRLDKHAGGSTGAQWAFDEDGERWLVKRYKGNVNRVATELLSNAIYRALGAKAAEAGTIHDEKGTLALTYPALDGENRRIDAPSREIGDHFMADALLANWDFIGLTDDNIMWDPDGMPFRVDQGGTLEFRAQGASKNFGPVPTEVWTLLSPKGGQGFGKVDIDEPRMREQAAEIAKAMSPAKLDELVDAAPFEDEDQKERIRQALAARVGWMGAFARGEEGIPKPAEKKAARQALTDGQRGLRLFPEQEDALFGYAEGMAPEVNAHLRATTKKSENPQINTVIRELDSLLRQSRTDTDVIAYQGFTLPEGSQPDQLVGQTLREDGYLNLTTEQGKARRRDAVLSVTLPEGTHAVFTGSLDDMPKEPQIIVRRGVKLRVVGYRIVNGKVYLDVVAMPEQMPVAKPFPKPKPKRKVVDDTEPIPEPPGSSIWDDVGEPET